MGFGTAVSTVFRKYVRFSGRARRSEYWWWSLFVGILSIAALLLDSTSGTGVSDGTGPVQGLLTVALLLPNLAVTVRRLHDTGRSGWRVLLGLIPIVGFILLLVWTLQDSNPGSNRFGFSPKEPAPSSTW